VVLPRVPVDLVPGAKRLLAGSAALCPRGRAARVEYARRGVTVAYKMAGPAPPTDPILEMEALALVREVEIAWLSELLTFIGNRALTPGSGSGRLWRCQYAKR
jgi:hypothetical protein